ncbi:hypothetical protein LTDYDHKI_CDS0021 [Exiguobacterium phage phiExGM16]
MIAHALQLEIAGVLAQRVLTHPEDQRSLSQRHHDRHRRQQPRHGERVRLAGPRPHGLHHARQRILHDRGRGERPFPIDLHRAGDAAGVEPAAHRARRHLSILGECVNREHVFHAGSSPVCPMTCPVMSRLSDSVT